MSKRAYEARLETAKRESTVQVLFKVARLLDARALERVAARGGPSLRRSHTALLPHIALEGTRITELAERLGVTKQAVSQLVDDLEAVDLLARIPDPDDARARRVVFTEHGRASLLGGLKELQALEAELETWIGRKALNQLRHALLGIHDRLAP